MEFLFYYGEVEFTDAILQLFLLSLVTVWSYSVAKALVLQLIRLKTSVGQEKQINLLIAQRKLIPLQTELRRISRSFYSQQEDATFKTSFSFSLVF